ncbi:hypothetical protein [Runella sp.]|uniref:hypothetical protein n=1 Tax=Runella sp. TaxID=1960881 RepID=UPI003D0EE11B
MQSEFKSRLPKNAGSFFSKAEIDKYRAEFKRAHQPLPYEPKDPEQNRQGEYFSREILEQLLATDCDGIRIYYGVAPETGGEIHPEGKTMMRRLFLVPVKIDEKGDGKDFQFKPIKKASGEKDGDGGKGGAGGGLPCPGFCNP